MTILVTGGAGFIGGNLVIDWLGQHDETIINVDKVTMQATWKTSLACRAMCATFSCKATAPWWTAYLVKGRRSEGGAEAEMRGRI